METKTYICKGRKHNSHMGVECFDESGNIFLFDRFNMVQINDVVKMEYDEKNFYVKIWVNDELRWDETQST
jgi:hypothetical protein